MPPKRGENVLSSATTKRTEIIFQVIPIDFLQYNYPGWLSSSTTSLWLLNPSAMAHQVLGTYFSPVCEIVFPPGSCSPTSLQLAHRNGQRILPPRCLWLGPRPSFGSTDEDIHPQRHLKILYTDTLWQSTILTETWVLLTLYKINIYCITILLVFSSLVKF